MKRRRFMGGLAGNLLATPLAAWAQTFPKGKGATTAAPVTRALPSSLAANTARNVGPYASAERSGQNITDYSGITYDSVGKRMCLFGGGHGPSQETDIRVLDLQAMQWSSLYPTTPRNQMTLANADSDFGRWISTNQPYARHSYNMSVVAGRRFYLFTPYGQADHLDGPSPPYGGRVCWYDFEDKAWSYSHYSNAQTPWAPYASAVLDPVSGRIIIAGTNSQGGVGNIWLYDPATDTFQAGPSFPGAIGYAHDIVYFPPDDSFYVFQSDGRVWRMTLGRPNAMLSSVAALNVTGTPPAASSRCGFAYDSINKRIGGNVTNGTFYTFDPASLAWTSSTMRVEAGSIGSPNQAFHCLDFDPVSGCFVFLGEASAPSTWLYRPASVPSGGASTTSPVGDLSVTLDLGAGKVAVFAGIDGVSQGDFVGEFVRQKCYLCRNPAFPDWRVYFRVDADASGKRIVGTGERDEVVVEYGRAGAGVPVHVTSPYTATVTKAGVAVATYTVPSHWWYARWRYQSSPRPVVRPPAALIARGWIPNFGSSGLFGLGPNSTTVSWAGPMSAPQGFSNVMGAGGDNIQIGFLTEYAADYVINQTPASLASLRTEGEWCGNWCTHIRDDTTGAVLDVRNNKLRYKADGGTVNDVPGGVSPAASANFVAVEAAHFYPCANLPWLLTEDPFYLEEMQFGCNWRLLFNQYHRSLQGLQGLVYPGETRAFAWGLRDMFLLAATCPVLVPQWLRPRSYWRSCIEDNRAYAEKFQKSPARIHALFKTWTRSDADAAWMSSWLNAVTGTAVGQGFTNWTPIFQWGVDKHIQQTNGTSGWPRQWPVPYYSIPNKAAVWGTPTLFFPTTAVDATTCASWADYWAYYKSGSPDAAGVGHTDGSGLKINDAGWDGHTIMQSQSGPSFFLHLRAVLAVALSRGIPGAQACYDYIQDELTNEVMPRFKAKGQARFSIEPTAVIPATRSANVQGLWWNDPPGSESGWGINLAQQGEVVFATWFTYDALGNPWWLSMAATRRSNNVYEGDLLATHGPAFDAAPFDPALVSRTVVGSGSLIFDDTDSGTFSYSVNGITQTKSITRTFFGDPIPECDFRPEDFPLTSENYQDIWWADPAGSESGWGMNIVHQGDTIFATWFTYDSDGSPLWLSTSARKVDEGVYSGELLRTTGPAFNSTPFDPALVVRTPVGDATLRFYNSSIAFFEYTVGVVVQSKRITRFVFRGDGAACQ